MATKLNILAVGFVAGLGLGIFATYNSMSEYSKDKAEVTLYEDRHVIRTRELLDRDRVFVEILAPVESGSYISLNGYLLNIEDKYDREIERAKIEKIVGW